ncbi:MULTISPECIES: protein-export chaperone SecB [Nosocomiicoccus]|uniref:Protein-export chaperone SecB n=1 Tax=Nosocomiicoccus massiliensis TaxID=1232430 RepID=A0AAF0YLP3_9STAP|nr:MULTISPECIES: protein-export chaperone SecB [Nosocomiicoccus]OFL47547.1 hypothetical protein HMPREF2767_02360 [Nosocomiicoccus sp. HMSC067E10]OFO52984.1 hypothetical protein HMPREF3029_01820 [Nosocomiicoccus sp. HMSC059G07]WOS96029.1 protein-export chaperone SecB [Nosocomiicoccus massiliensis]
MKAELKFSEYEIEEITYKINVLSEVEVMDDDENAPRLICNVIHSEEDNSRFIIKLGLELGDSNLSKNNIYLKCIVIGVFEQSKSAELNLVPNAVSILFPYLRSIISDVTSKGNRRPIILPPININEFLNRAEKMDETIE